MMTALMLGTSTLSLGACVTSTVYTARVEKAYPAIGQMVEVNGHYVHVIKSGTSGPTVLMIHGASANAREFTASLTPRLEDQATILMADRPGHGYSERFSGAESLAAQAAQMAGAIKQLGGGAPAVVVGHSFGGAVALRVALDRPDLVQGLVLVAPVTHDWGGGGESWYNGVASAPLIGPVFSQVVPLVGPASVNAGIEGVFKPQPAPPNYLEDAGIKLLFRPPNFRANARDVNALEQELAAQSKRYPELKVPVIVFSGSQDTVIKPQLHVGELKKQIPVELIALPDEGHMPHHGHGQAIAEAIMRLASAGNSG